MMKYVTAMLTLAAAITAAGQPSAELVITNANVRTLVSRDARARAIAVRGGRIVAVGTDEAIEKLAGPNTKRINAGGKLVLPGFNDAHVHLTGIGNMFSHLDARELRSRRAVIESIEQYSLILPSGRWLLGRGWRDEAVLPSLSELNAASPANPLLIYSHDYSQAIANSRALALARLDPTSAVITGGELQAVSQRIPPNFVGNLPEIIETAGNYAASVGVTSAQDVHSDDLFDVLNEMDAKGRLKLRVYDCIGLGERQKAIKAGLRAASGTPMVRRGCLKGSADGADGEIDELAKDIIEADRAGLQVMVHAIGPRSNGNVLTAFERVTAANGPRDRRFRVEHAARMHPADLERLKRSGVTASMQPFLFYNGPATGDDHRKLLSLGASIAFGSDSSMIPLDPLLGIYAAVNSGSRSISVYEAVRAYTLGSAYAEFQEREKGTIEPGKLADIVILSKDIFTSDPALIRDARVLVTILDGKIVYDAR